MRKFFKDFITKILTSDSSDKKVEAALRPIITYFINDFDNSRYVFLAPEIFLNIEKDAQREEVIIKGTQRGDFLIYDTINKSLRIWQIKYRESGENSTKIGLLKNFVEVINKESANCIYKMLEIKANKKSYSRDRYLYLKDKFSKAVNIGNINLDNLKSCSYDMKSLDDIFNLPINNNSSKYYIWEYIRQIRSGTVNNSIEDKVSVTDIIDFFKTTLEYWKYPWFEIETYFCIVLSEFLRIILAKKYEVNRMEYLGAEVRNVTNKGSQSDAVFFSKELDAFICVELKLKYKFSKPHYEKQSNLYDEMVKVCYQNKCCCAVKHQRDELVYVHELISSNKCKKVECDKKPKDGDVGKVNFETSERFTASKVEVIYIFPNRYIEILEKYELGKDSQRYIKLSDLKACGDIMFKDDVNAEIWNALSCQLNEICKL